MSTNKRMFSSEEACNHVLRLLEEEADLVDDIGELVDYDDEHILEEVDGDEVEENEDAVDMVVETLANKQKRALKKKLLTKKRLVNSIDSALNEQNYEEMEAVEGAEIYTCKLGRKDDKKAPDITWTNIKPTAQQGRQPAREVVTGDPGTLKSRKAKNSTTPSTALSCFITDELIEAIVGHTNQRIAKALLKLGETQKESCKHYSGETDDVEVRAFIGLCYLRAALGQNHLRYQLLWSDDLHYLFGAAMSKNRFGFLHRFFSFDDEDTREERWERDRFAAFREIFEIFNAQCSKHVVPSEYLCIDETLYPMRNQIGIRTYIKSKPAKYGLLVKSLNDSKYPYTYKALPYAGVPADTTNARYYLEGEDIHVKTLVDQMERDMSLQGRCISMDRLYTSVKIANWLLNRNITMVGTFNILRVGIPKEIKCATDRDNLSSKTYWEAKEGKIVATSYVVTTKSKGKTNIIVVSTVQPLLMVTKDDDKRKPAIIKLYDFTKIGTDIVDQRNTNITTKTKSSRWPKVAFSYVLDVARNNVLVSFANNCKVQDVDSFDFTLELAKELVEPQIKRRSLDGLNQNVIEKLKQAGLVFPPKEVLSDDEYPSVGPARRCHMCLDEIKNSKSKKRGIKKTDVTAGASPTKKGKKDNLHRVSSQCQKCGEAVCKKHLYYTCQCCKK